MSSPSREQLLGYLLGALEPEELEQVEQEIAQDVVLERELKSLKARLDGLGLVDRPQWFEPPAGLARRTCHLVALQTAPPVSPARGALPQAMATDVRHDRQYRWTDLLVAAAVLIAAASLFFPALSHSRFQSEVAMCQNHLRQLGVALHDYSSHQPDGRFIQIPATGNRGVAGIYAVNLVDQQFVNDPRLFLCSTMAGTRRQFRLPSPEQLDLADGITLAELQATMGGDFGYTLGVYEDGKLVPPRDQRRPDYVLLCDAPSDRQPGRQTSNHRGRGQNLLYEDGRVRFIPTIPCPQLRDDPFHNLRGEVAAGVHPFDSVCGRSNDRPIPVKFIGGP